MKALVLFHSVCGNTYLLARQYADTLSALGVDTALYRLPDPQYDHLAPILKPHGPIRTLCAMSPSWNSPRRF